MCEYMGRALSLELRWVRDGQVPVEVLNWITGVAGDRAPRTRVDAYWLAGDLECSTLKVRAVINRRTGRIRARRVECKQLQERLGLVQVTPQLVGIAELWEKSRVDAAPAPLPEADDAHPSPEWVFVQKQRIRLRTAGQVQRTSTSIEVTETCARDRVAWSVAAQARGPVRTDILRTLLRESITVAFPTWPEAVSLGPAESGSYGAWLRRSVAHGRNDVETASRRDH
jgi:hypothetical protein